MKKMIPLLALLTVALAPEVGKAQEFAASDGHTCAIADQGVVCWGDNSAGQLETPRDLGRVHALHTSSYGHAACATTDRGVRCWGYQIPQSVLADFQNADLVALGGSASACLKKKHETRCWTWDSKGSVQARPVPPMGLLKDPQKIVVGYTHACALDEGKVKCWGEDKQNLGLLEVPTDLKNPRELSGSGRHTCVLDGDDVRCWGDTHNHPMDGLPRDLKNPRLLSVSEFHSCVVDQGEKIRCWGQSWAQSPPRARGRVKALNSGRQFSCLIDDEGVNCWGYTAKVNRPLRNPKEIAGGQHYLCVLDDEGVKCFGSLLSGATQVPRSIHGAFAISTGDFHTCALDPYGLQCWGHTDYSAIKEPLLNPTHLTPTNNGTCVVDQSAFVCWEGPNNRYYVRSSAPLVAPRQIASGLRHVCAIDADSVKCFGYYIQNPKILAIPETIRHPRMISAGDNHVCALHEDGMNCWGDIETFIPTAALVHPRAIASGASHACVLDDLGVRCWGANESGQLDAPRDLLYPLAIVAGRGHTCALEETGMRCWGANDKGQSTPPGGISFHWLGAYHFSLQTLDTDFRDLARFAYSHKASFLEQVSSLTATLALPTERLFVMNGMRAFIEDLNAQTFRSEVLPRYIRVLDQANREAGKGGLVDFKLEPVYAKLALKIIYQALENSAAFIPSSQGQDQAAALARQARLTVESGASPAAIKTWVQAVRGATGLLEALTLQPDTRGYGLLVQSLTGYLDR